MAKDWDEESSGDDSPAPIVRKSKFGDEEDEEDVLDSWDAAEDSEVEREKAAKAEAAKKAAEEEAKRNKKTKAERLEELRNLRAREKELAGEDDSDDDESEGEKRARMRKMEQEADLKNAADLFGEIGISKNRSEKPVLVHAGDGADPSQAVDLSALKLFSPTTRDDFVKLRETLIPLVAGSNNTSKAHYGLFVQEFVRSLVKDLSSDQIKKVASVVTTASNEKMKEEKASQGTKKSKAAKTKTTLNADRGVASRADTAAYEDGLEDDDFM